jgi:hypothetical protein
MAGSEQLRHINAVAADLMLYGGSRLGRVRGFQAQADDKTKRIVRYQPFGHRRGR